MKPSTAARLLLVLFVASGVLGVRSLAPPAPKPASAPAAEFSAERARETVAAIAQRPRPVGSAEHDRVRDWLVERLRGLGVEPQVQTAVAISGNEVVTVSNVLARLPGRERGKAVLLMAHYDSVPSGPGASDDASGVATLVETLRALKSGEGLENDVIFLFTDGEEVDLHGARAFAEEHPWAADVGVVLNIEARGASGPSLMFETSPGNATLVRTLTRQTREVAYSFSYEVYKRMPNDTDFTVMRQKGMPGLNFAFIHDPAAYHSAEDTLARQDPRSVQHHGDLALALARAFGNESLPPAAGERDLVYFNVLGPVAVSYLASWVLPFTLLLALATGAVLAMGLRRRRFTAGAAVGGSLVCLLATGAIAYLATLAARFVFPGPYDFTIWGGTHSTPLLLWALALATLGLVVALAHTLAGHLQGLVAGGLLVWLTLGVALAFLAPGATALVDLPLAFTLAAVAVSWRAEPDRPLAVSAVVLAALAVVVTALLWMPVLGLLGIALGPGAAPVMAGATVLLVLGLFAVVLAWGRPARRAWTFPVGMLLVALALIVAVRLSAGFGPENRKPDSLLYLLDADAGTAQWVSYDRASDVWTSKYIPADAQGQTLPPARGILAPVRTAPAPVVELEPARVEATLQPAAKSLLLTLTWPEQVGPEPVARAFVTLRSDEVLGALRVNGKPFDGVGGDAGKGKEASLVYYGPPAEGLRIEISPAGERPIEVEVSTQRFGLPVVALEPRPAWTMPRPGWGSDSSLTYSKTVVNPAPPAPAPDPSLRPSPR